MPITKAAKKSLRQSLRRHQENMRRRKKFRELRKKIIQLAEDKKIKEAEETFRAYQKAVDKAAKTNVIAKNTANRKKSRLQLWLKHFQKTAKENH